MGTSKATRVRQNRRHDTSLSLATQSGADHSSTFTLITIDDHTSSRMVIAKFHLVVSECTHDCNV